jgi:Zn-dependent protease
VFGQIDFLAILYRVPALLIGLSFHEAAHAYMAYRCGDPTARNLGRMTLDPLRHLDLMGTLCLLLVGFGWAKPVPINPRNFKNIRRDEILVSLAGIVTNLILAFVFTGVLFFVSRVTTNTIVINLLYYTIFINIALAVFNIIPIPPLDGYHVLRNSVNGGYQFFSMVERYGRFILIALLLFGVAGRIIGLVGNTIFGLFISFFELLF